MIYEIPQFVRAQMAAIKSTNNISRFSSNEILPFNRNISTDGNFAPSSITHQSSRSQVSYTDHCSRKYHTPIIAVASITHQ